MLVKIQRGDYILMLYKSLPLAGIFAIHLNPPPSPPAPHWDLESENKSVFTGTLNCKLQVGRCDCLLLCDRIGWRRKDQSS